MDDRDWHPLIMAGLPRSGTTLLSTFLASQAGSTFITDYLSSFTDVASRLSVPWNVELSRTQRRVALAIVRDQLLRFRHPVLVGVDGFRTLRELHRAVLSELAKPGDRVVGHKLLLSHDVLPAVLQQTDWYVVVLYRDPRDAAVSYFHRTGGGVEGYLDEWRKMIALIAAPHNPRLFGIRYEELVRDPSVALAPLFRTLGLPLDPTRASLMFDRGPAGQVQWAGNATFETPRRPFDPRAVGRWRSMPGSEIVRYAGWTCRREVAQLEYEPGPEITKVEALRWETHRLMHGLTRGADRAWQRGREHVLKRWAPSLRGD